MVRFHTTMKYLLLIIIVAVCYQHFAISEYTESEDNYNYITFTMNSYRAVCTPDNNFVYSPLSLSVIYNVLYQSANGQAESDLRKILLPYSNQYVSKSSILTSQMDSLAQIAQNPKIKLANKFYNSDTIEFDRDFINIAQHYQAMLENINFRYKEHALTTMNNWVENRTHGMIKNLISPDHIDDFTEMVIINTVYFKDSWLNEFYENQVNNRIFYTQSGPVKTQFIEDTSHYDIAYRPNLGLFALRIPYKNGFEFWIILPMINNSLENLIRNISADYIYDIKQNFVNKKADVIFPIFTIENYLECSAPSPGTFQNRDFKITNGERSSIGAIIQKTKIIVNREGTEAASATYAVGVGLGSFFVPPETPFIFEANRPFMYIVITPNTLKPIFIGHFMTPTP